MSSSSQIPPIQVSSLEGPVTFGPFRLTVGERLLTRDGAPVEIGGRTFDLLVALVEQPGRVLAKRDLLKRVWPDVVVEDGSLRFHMAGLRKLLGDGENGARYIATQVGVGYAFVATLQRAAPVAEASPVAAPLPRDGGSYSMEAAGRLPARLPRVFGRDTDVHLLTGRIPETPLFTIVGAAGVGKTTLAVEVGHMLMPHFAGKVRFVDLATLEDPALLASAIAGALGALVQSEDPMAVILGHIRQEHLLLILDNCEHLVDAVSRVVERLMDAAPHVHIVATSREPLRVRAEHVHWLGSLAYPDTAVEGLSLDALLAFPAVALFVERASAGNSALRFDVDAVRVVSDMCGRLDGMALPIELTAVRVAAHGLEATAQLLGERFSLAWAGRRTALPRQQTLQATLDWSYNLLPEAERLTLERLSVFLGPFSIDAALQVVTDEEVPTDAAVLALDELTTKSLISPDRLGNASTYRLLEMTRAYAREKLLGRGPQAFQAVARRHAAFFVAKLEEPAFSDRRCLDRFHYFSRQLGNIRSALDWSFGPDGDVALAVRLAAASVPVFTNMSLLVECRDWCARAVAHLDGHRDTAVEIEIQAALGLALMFTRGNSEAAETALRRALAVATTLGDHWNQLRLLGRLQIFHERIGDYATAHGWADMAVKVAGVIDTPEAAAVAASLAGISHHLAGDQSRARQELEFSIRQSMPSDRRWTVYFGFDHRNRSGIALARTLWLLGLADQARAVAARTVREAAGLEHAVTHCIALLWTLSVDLWAGDLEKAEVSLANFARAAEVNALGPYIAASGGLRGELAIQRGHVGEALDWLEESLARLRAARYELLTTTFSLALAQGLMLSGRQEEALDLVDAAVGRCAGNGELFSMPELLRVKADVLRALPDRDPAEVEALLQDALAWSRRQAAKAWELRAAIDLARLWMDQGQPARALALLRPLRDGFQEGLDTADLRAADQLLLMLADMPGTAGGGGALSAWPW
ncbi:ATP-binding protein [Nitrospirillum viridazoti]|uniref:Transcriptional regulator n=1 Tax=Nitrospirillum viridazoti CBAmc TaxID=1441467 RepID=A0A248K1L9_9PROT|nr:winged helix-turn-helix domain-containing protein [Nitrospirillum amazonense]ASG24873.1 transcriptional regulator [Nitrospirillum amazonense CBAmc]TWB37098.1 putative ATPase [Nitrospirillum amazonense]